MVVSVEVASSTTLSVLGGPSNEIQSSKGARASLEGSWEELSRPCTRPGSGDLDQFYHIYIFSNTVEINVA